MTLRDVKSLDGPPVALIDPVVRCLGDRDTDVQIEAARVLSSYGEAALAAVPDLIVCLTSRSATLRGSAAAALLAVGGPADQVVTELTRLVRDPDPSVVDTAAAGLHRLAPSAASAVPALVDAIRRNEIDCQPSDALAAALIAIDPPAEVLQELLDPIDPELRELVLGTLRTVQSGQESDLPTSTETDST